MYTNEKRLKGLLMVLSVFIWYKCYFFLLELISSNLPEKITVGTTSIFEMIMLVVFVLTVAPVSFGIRHLLLKFLEQK